MEGVVNLKVPLKIMLSISHSEKVLFSRYNYSCKLWVA